MATILHAESSVLVCDSIKHFLDGCIGATIIFLLLSTTLGGLLRDLSDVVFTELLIEVYT